MNRIAIDPGDVHVGWAYHSGDDVEAGETTPSGICEALVQMLTREMVDEVVIEEFVLYDREYSNQTWSPMKTSQLIGALKLICHWFHIPVVEQGAYIKKPTRAKMKALGIEHVKGGSIHSRDAELHLYYRKLRSERRGS